MRNLSDATATHSRWWLGILPQSRVRVQRQYIIIGSIVGGTNLALMLTLVGSPSTERFIFLLLALTTLSLIPVRPVMSSLIYLVVWILLLQVPHAPAGDMVITNAIYFFYLGIFLPLRAAIILALIVPMAIAIPSGPISAVVSQSFLAACMLLSGIMLRRTETTLREEVSSVTEQLASIRVEIAREMHDLVAYSMSQTALRAQRAAADTSYSLAARKEFAAIESTATDALHELRLILRALRKDEKVRDQNRTTGLGTVVLDLEESVRAVADDLSTSGYTVTYRCRGDRPYSRLQAATLSRVLREMSSNVLRHADRFQPVTITLTQDADKARLVMTNGVSSSSRHTLPSSGMGILGMQERLSTIGGSLATLLDNGTWLASASISFPPSSTPIAEENRS